MFRFTLPPDPDTLQLVYWQQTRNFVEANHWIKTTPSLTVASVLAEVAAHPDVPCDVMDMMGFVELATRNPSNWEDYND